MRTSRCFVAKNIERFVGFFSCANRYKLTELFLGENNNELSVFILGSAYQVIISVFSSAVIYRP